ncbi:MAG: nicotinate-nucleotide adenylyltransferase [Euryarchaeota archaeon]|jgi:nicotinamide-nucleotide adenylyltransferase|nr:nicotinate-nucleotide adenylyltransferase [Euryarchaeota archaeon]MDP6364024.1 nicotinamide-nucleotide adenylyltransferase [Candidatus Poseidoniia archaeon]MDP6658771.1 nicotinamide-nucleotide adenylyltransferase [Candidatus Poseidoniia archaeon]MDP6846603.1 nicotinamide-nucleotide adenylyltransferase [Candidatus Poseidoniia archaeon]MDP7006872.1 nicotinamide-nucleotide adenylyltransferase [Candidatus Poseidoniia archaeon]|tara:strand:+ start:627 stop:1133 length:507 start_codon:yes stop_codon:yes gene_type:complete
MSVALLPGRFQPFHRGHVAIAQAAVADGHELLVMIGSAQEAGTWENPFSADERREMVAAGMAAAGLAPRAIMAVEDLNDYDRWVAHVVARLGPFDCVYSANTLVQRLFGAAGYPVIAPELQNRRAWEGAAIRQALAAAGAWEAALQPEVAALVRGYGGPERLRALAPG